MTGQDHRESHLHTDSQFKKRHFRRSLAPWHQIVIQEQRESYPDAEKTSHLEWIPQIIMPLRKR